MMGMTLMTIAIERTMTTSLQPNPVHFSVPLGDANGRNHSRHGGILYGTFKNVRFHLAIVQVAEFANRH
jgi:hypothetical protein